MSSGSTDIPDQPVKVTVEIVTNDPYLTDTLNEFFHTLEDSGQIQDWAYCSSDDPHNHQGNTCPIHEDFMGKVKSLFPRGISLD